MSDATPDNPRDLPLPDYDHLPTATLQHRIRALSAEQLRRVLAYERTHADRADVRTIMEARLRSLDEGAEPSTGSPTAERPEAATSPTADTGVSPQTSGPPQNPPSHGTPSNPAQPRT